MALERPQFFSDKKDLPRGVKRIDDLESSLRELFFVDYPRYKKDSPESGEPLKRFLNEHLGYIFTGLWVCYPWLKVAVRTLPEQLYFRLRTARNQYVITEEEQNNYRKIKVGVAGLSVGSGIVSALVVSGGPKILKIADFDKLEVSNLNRIRARLADVGENKTHVVARGVWELDPFADLHIWDNGISKDSVGEFITGKPRLDVFVDEMDSLDLKIVTRHVCRRANVPVIMATDNGDTVLLDVERYDQSPQPNFFNGIAGNIKPKDLSDMTKEKWLRISTQMIGPEYMTPALQDSILSVGKTLGGVPQLGTTANVAGAAVSLAIRRIANNQSMPSGRYVISLEDKVIPRWNSAKNRKSRKNKTRVFKSRLFSRK